MNKLLVINGPNLNMLGTRDKGIYGSMTLDRINEEIEKEAQRIGIEVHFFQSNYEGELVTKVQQALNNYEGIIINPGAYGHYSIALRDAIEDVGLPCIEVHISNIFSRDEFRRHSVISAVCRGQICGFGYKGYILALNGIIDMLKGVKY